MIFLLTFSGVPAAAWAEGVEELGSAVLAAQAAEGASGSVAGDAPGTEAGEGAAGDAPAADGLGDASGEDDAAAGDRLATDGVAAEPDAAAKAPAATEGAQAADASSPEAEAAATITVTAKVVGVTDAAEDGSRSWETWAPATEVALSAGGEATAWDALTKLMDAAGLTYSLENHGEPHSVTTADGKRTLAMEGADGVWSYWSFYVDGEPASTYASGHTARAGETYELRYIAGDADPAPEGGVEVNPGAEHPGQDVAWNGFGNGGSGSVTDLETPSAPVDPSWTSDLLTEGERAAGASASASDPLVIGGKVYIVSASTSYDENYHATKSPARLRVIDRATGKVEREVGLGHTMDTTSRPVYADGILVVPLAGGYLQALSVSTLETIWVVPAASTGQSLCTLTVSDGYVYVSTLDSFGTGASSSIAASGSVRRYNLHTGALAGESESSTTGYYWAGGAMVGGYYVIGDDSGTVTVYTADLSRAVSSAKVSTKPLRSTIAVADGYAYVVSRDDGTLHKLAVSGAGEVSEVASAKFATYSTSSPTIAGGYAYVGGKQGYVNGVLARIDLATMAVETVTAAAGAALGGEVKSTPLVSTAGGQTRVYFTVNAAQSDPDDWSAYVSGGGVYMWRVGDAEATCLYDPTGEYAQYCMASVAADSEGNLYFTNDSGHLFQIPSGKVRVSFDAQGGSEVASQLVSLGGAVARPADPTRAGYAFGGWYLDADCTRAWDFSGTVASSMTLYAKWVKAAEPGSGGGSGSGSASAGGSGAQGGGAVSTGGQAASGGTVVPARAPVAAADAANAAVKASDEDGAGDRGDAADDIDSSDAEDAVALAAAGARGASDTDGSSLPVALVAGAVGVVGLVAAAAWLWRLKRRG